MARRLDQIIVVDVEATCWDGPPPAGQEPEIIEIGICPLVIATGERLERRSLLVKPKRSEVSEFCTQLTTLTPEMVAGGIPFAEACHILKKDYLTSERLWASYGDYDRGIFEKQCRERQIAYPFGKSHLNVKTLFALSRGLTREVGLDGAMQMLGQPLEGTHHRGHDDAWNIAAVLATLLRSLKAHGQ